MYHRKQNTPITVFKTLQFTFLLSKTSQGRCQEVLAQCDCFVVMWCPGFYNSSCWHRLPNCCWNTSHYFTLSEAGKRAKGVHFSGISRRLKSLLHHFLFPSHWPEFHHGAMLRYQYKRVWEMTCLAGNIATPNKFGVLSLRKNQKMVIVLLVTSLYTIRSYLNK